MATISFLLWALVLIDDYYHDDDAATVASYFVAAATAAAVDANDDGSGGGSGYDDVMIVYTCVRRRARALGDVMLIIGTQTHGGCDGRTRSVAVGIFN